MTDILSALSAGAEALTQLPRAAQSGASAEAVLNDMDLADESLRDCADSLTVEYFSRLPYAEVKSHVGWREDMHGDDLVPFEMLVMWNEGDSIVGQDGMLLSVRVTGWDEENPEKRFDFAPDQLERLGRTFLLGYWDTNPADGDVAAICFYSTSDEDEEYDDDDVFTLTPQGALDNKMFERNADLDAANDRFRTFQEGGGKIEPS